MRAAWCKNIAVVNPGCQLMNIFLKTLNLNFALLTTSQGLAELLNLQYVKHMSLKMLVVNIKFVDCQ